MRPSTVIGSFAGVDAEASPIEHLGELSHQEASFRTEVMAFCFGCAGAGLGRGRVKACVSSPPGYGPRGGSGKPPGGPPSRSPFGPLFDPSKAERPAWAEALWIILRFHICFGMLYGLYAHLRIRHGLLTAFDQVQITGRHRKILSGVELVGDRDWEAPEALLGLGELQNLAEKTLARILLAAEELGIRPKRPIRVLVVDELPDTQVALSVLATDGSDLILVDGTVESPRLMPAIIGHEAAHHIADHLPEFHALLYGIATPFSAFLPLAPVLLVSGFLFNRVERDQGAPEGKAFSMGLAFRRLQDSLDTGVKLMFLNRFEALENLFASMLNPWRQVAELEADRIGFLLGARAGFELEQNHHLIDLLDREEWPTRLAKKLPFLDSVSA
uniref:Peptidase M48 domain-containing protein n=1 Tax=Rhodosorus marinus TaxID=101924 RepID=A0A7S2ZMZ1_9RHOD|mmetsp:Transcript_25368/g.100167  ORF Transcript_25368/g.100167 Transcript_25368/m.100167 type:complete len:387 (+) Transcript_25368:232-1392(+)